MKDGTNNMRFVTCCKSLNLITIIQVINVCCSPPSDSAPYPKIEQFR